MGAAKMPQLTSWLRSLLWLLFPLLLISCSSGQSLSVGTGADQKQNLSSPSITSLNPLSAGLTSGGYTVTISGNNFSLPTVFFGETQAVVTSADSTSLTVDVPAGTGSVMVKLTNPDGGSASTAFTYSNSLFDFSDDFQRPDNSSFGPAWLLAEGAFLLQNHQALSQATGARLVLASASATDVLISSSFQLNAANSAASPHLLARYTGPTAPYYDGYLTTTQSPLATTATISRNIDGTNFTTLNTITLPSPVTTGTLELSAVGDTVMLSLNGAPILDAIDSSLSTPGTVGIQTGAANAFNNFTAAAVSPTPVSLTASAPTFSDSFQRPDSLILGGSWIQQAPCGVGEGGDIAIVNHQAVVPAMSGTIVQNAPSCTATELNGSRGLVNGVHNSDVTVTSSVTVGQGTCSWLLARVTGPQDYYIANLCYNQNVYCAAGQTNCAIIQKMVGGNQTLLARQAISFAGTASYSFTVQGSTLSLSVNGTQFSVNDASITDPGTVGILGPMGAAFNSFSVTALSFP